SLFRQMQQALIQRGLEPYISYEIARNAFKMLSKDKQKPSQSTITTFYDLPSDYLCGIILILKVQEQINSLEGWHHHLNTDLNHIIHPQFYMFIRAIQNDYAYNSAISSRHTATGTIPPRKKLFVNRNAPLRDLENRYKQQALTLEEYLEKVMRLIGIKKF
ncbi:unnamed protein product, partial [Didymodactylos carnosus]